MTTAEHDRPSRRKLITAFVASAVTEEKTGDIVMAGGQIQARLKLSDTNDPFEFYEISIKDQPHLSFTVIKYHDPVAVIAGELATVFSQDDNVRTGKLILGL